MLKVQIVFIAINKIASFGGQKDVIHIYFGLLLRQSKAPP